MKKIGIIVMVLCLISTAVLFAGGGSQGGGGGSSGEQVTLKFWTDMAGGRALEYFKAYEKTHPNIKLEVSVYESQDYKTQSRLALVSGTKPDIWQTNTGTFLDQFIEAGGCMDITNYISQYGWDKSLGDASLDVGRRNGRLYAIPNGGFFTWQALYANKEFFRKNNIPYPKTVDEMIATAQRIRAAGLQPIAFGNKDGWPGQIILGDYMGQLVGADYAEKLNKGTIKWDNSPELKTAFETLAKLAKGGAFIDGYATSDMNIGGIQSWLAQKAAFLYVGTWFYDTDTQATLDFEVETIPLPLINANTKLKSIQLYPDPCIFVDKDTKHSKEAIEFLNYCVQQEWYEIYSDQGKCLTPNAEANKKLDAPAWLKSEPILSQMSLPMFNYWTTQFPMPVEETLANNIKMVFEGSISVDQALKNIEQEHARNR
ncbi:ABC transporter substrate-binding protein [Treponema primitia]|uniref:ABC transporter substrate-binding protein n=1 Tax=Treponema primitia TaxID=88058 RepID=UPI0002554EB1|nr:ABC transporter substrate-binding protein [Treponema primitia]